MKQITSHENPHFKALKKLCLSGRERRKTGLALLDGLHLIESFVEHCGKPVEILLSEKGARVAENADFLKDVGGGGQISILSDSLFAELATVETPSGIMAVVQQPRCTHGLNQEQDAVLLDAIQDPGNLGTIFRSAAAAGFRQVLLSADCAQAWSPKTLRAAMGAHFQLEIHESCDLPAFLGGYRGRAVLTTLEPAPSLYSVDLKKTVAWVFGNEGQGVRAEVAAVTGLQVRIPMPGEINSLNVAAAASICLFETVRQRQPK